MEKEIHDYTIVSVLNMNTIIGYTKGIDDIIEGLIIRFHSNCDKRLC